jgi:glycosyltransferase involved in cell wall biosynthesis
MVRNWWPPRDASGVLLVTEVGAREPRYVETTVGIIDAAWWNTGHHPTYLRGVVDSLLAAGADVRVVGPPGLEVDPSAVVGSSARLPPSMIVRSARWQRSATTLLRRAGAAVLFDLNVDLSGSRYGVLPPAIRRGAFVLHGLAHIAAPGGVRGTARATLARRGLHTLTRHGATIVVHTLHAVDQLARIGIHAHHVPLPVQQRSMPGAADRTKWDPPFILYLGDRRPEKGFDLLVAALESAPDLPPVVVAGPPSSAGTSIPLVQELGFVDEASVGALLATASAVVMPYTERFRVQGAASSVALEALIAGCPIIAPTWIVDQLSIATPAVQVFAGDPGSLASAMREAVKDGPALRSALTSVGISRTLAQRHSFDAYVACLLDLVMDPT